MRDFKTQVNPTPESAPQVLLPVVTVLRKAIWAITVTCSHPAPRPCSAAMVLRLPGGFSPGQVDVVSPGRSGSVFGPVDGCPAPPGSQAPASGPHLHRRLSERHGWRLHTRPSALSSRGKKHTGRAEDRVPGQVERSRQPEHLCIASCRAAALHPFMGQLRKGAVGRFQRRRQTCALLQPGSTCLLSGQAAAPLPVTLSPFQPTTCLVFLALSGSASQCSCWSGMCRPTDRGPPTGSRGPCCLLCYSRGTRQSEAMLLQRHPLGENLLHLAWLGECQVGNTQSLARRK